MSKKTGGNPPVFIKIPFIVFSGYNALRVLRR